MLDDYGFEFYEENAFPIAYLLTFRTFGTWLHGNRKGAVQRSRDPRWRIVPVPPNVPLNKSLLSELKQPQVVLDKQQRTFVTEAIEEVLASKIWPACVECAYQSYPCRDLEGSQTRENCQ
jgi:hypothetical protein